MSAISTPDRPQKGVRIGGRQKGSRNKIKLVATEIAQAALSRVDAVEEWEKLLTHSDKRIALDALKYLSDRLWGKPAQSVLLGQDKDRPFKVVFEVLGQPADTLQVVNEDVLEASIISPAVKALEP